MRILVINSPKYGKFNVLYDDVDHELVLNHRWHVSKPKRNGLSYAFTYINSRSKSMHRIIMGHPLNKVIDHIDGNGLNNQRNNLRACLPHQNIANQRIQISNKSGYKGVSFDNEKKKYRVWIHFNNKKLTGGRFSNPIEAAKKYNELALKYHGEFAKLNQFNPK